MNLTHVNPGELAFALPQAVNLAEMGQTLRDKQLGMVFVILEPWIYVNNKQL
jgi:AP-4 complex subunit epsilon-1